jgi:hypothetical protein
MRFDLVLIADWSAAASPTSATHRVDAIWIAETGPGTPAREYHFRTRAAAETWLTARLQGLSGHRVLLGFDFAFGWPRGFAERLTGGTDPRGLWRHLAHHITDTALNANNRFAVAAALNRAFPQGPGPFWSRPPGLDLPDLPPRRTGIDYSRLGLAEHRLAERLARAKPVWMLSNPGAVGSQSLMGQPLLHRLTRAFPLHAWPFDPAAALPRAGLVLAEVYPSLLGPLVAAEAATGIEKDRAQVRLLARALQRLDAAGQLRQLFTDLPPEAVDEGWILAAARAELLQRAAGDPMGG